MDLITREDAYRKGLKHYYTGRPCKRQHQSKRFVSTGACVMCLNWKPLAGTERPNVGMPPSGYMFSSGTELSPELMAYVHARVLMYTDAFAAEYQRLAAAHPRKEGEDTHHVTARLIGAWRVEQGLPRAG